MKKTFAALVGVSALILSTGAASAAWKEPASAYGLCISNATGYARVLERGKNISDSVYGKCKKTEQKITVYSRAGVDKLVRPLTKGFELTFDGVTGICKPNGVTAAGLARIACTNVVTPSPSPSPTATPPAP